MPSIDELDALLDDPARWGDLDPEKLRHLLFYQCLAYGLQPAEDKIAGLMDLHRLAVARIHPAARRQVVVHVARAVERVHREHDLREGAGCTNALLPFLLEDPDPSVVSSAATEMALLLPLENGDPLTGPRYVRALLDQVSGEDARAGIIAGLLQLGDPRVAPLVVGAWQQMGDEGRQTLALLIQAFRGVHTLTVEFLVSWLEDEARRPKAAAFGTVAATLARAGGHAGEHGVAEVRRTFPVTDAPEDQPFEVVRELALDAFAPSIEDRLSEAARGEEPPQLMPHVLSYWGFDLAAYRLATKAAAATRESRAGLCDPVRVDLVPNWPEEPEQETLLEWGIFNPMGPSINTMRLTPTGASSSALVYTLYHPTGSASRVMALLPEPPDGGLVASLVLQVMAHNGKDGVWLLRSLPDYVHVPEGSPVSRAAAAEGVSAARRAAVSGGEERMDLRAHVERLARLAADPWRTTEAEMENERATGGEQPGARAGGGAAGGPDGGASYEEWLAQASAPAHVAAVRGQLPIAWQRSIEAEPGDTGESD